MTGYIFPDITDIHQIQAAIANKDEFFISDKGSYLVSNYSVSYSTTFPEIVDNNTAILRECRGIIFNKKTGKIIRRPWYKFFNIGEKNETNIKNLDFTQPHIVLEKLDGSMIAPFEVDGKIIYGSKMGETFLTPHIKEFVKKNPSYHFFTQDCISKNNTPIFEFCSNKARIVISHPVDRLVLTGIRNNINGNITDYNTMVELAKLYNIEVVNAYHTHGIIDNPEEFLEYTKNLRNAEGFVVRFDNGYMVKVKADEYILFHKTLDSLRFEKDVLVIVLTDKIDDTLPLVKGDLEYDLKKYNDAVLSGLKELSTKLWNVVREAYDNTNGSKKDFAINYVNKNYKQYSPVLFSIWDLLEDGECAAFEVIKKYVLSHTSTGTKVDMVRYMWNNVRWRVNEITED